LPDAPKTADLIGKIVSGKRLSQTDAAALLGVHRSMVTRFMNGEREPVGLSCLILAALSETMEERAFWVGKSGVTSKQMELLADLLKIPEPTLLSGDERQLIDFWRNPQTAIERSVRDTLEILLAQRPVAATVESEVPVPEVPAPQTSLESKNARWHVLLEAILDSGIESFQVGIKANLESWAQVALIERRTGAAATTPDPLPEDLAKRLAEADRIIKWARGDEEGAEKSPKKSA